MLQLEPKTTFSFCLPMTYTSGILHREKFSYPTGCQNILQEALHHVLNTSVTLKKGKIFIHIHLMLLILFGTGGSGDEHEIVRRPVWTGLVSHGEADV